MITYNKIAWGLPLICRMYGSAIPRSLPPAAISAGITAVFYVTIDAKDYEWWRHPYPFQIFSFVVGFVVVFRWGLLLHFLCCWQATAILLTLYLEVGLL